jgi:hypothetical protein
MKKESAKKKIKELVERFESHLEEYKNKNYDEEQTKTDFIAPFFEALGWDVFNKQNLSEYFREVVVEDRVRHEGRIKKPDYAFRNNGKRCFFVEAKKPNVNIKENKQSAFQLKRYAWSANLNVSILTDFEEFAVYDCSKEPKVTESTTQGRLKYLSFKDYVKEFDYLWSTFSKEAVSSGDFRRYVSKKEKKGSQAVDDKFLSYLDEFRVSLAHDVFKNNKAITEDQLNIIVQKIVNRVIFLRIAEDRDIERYGALQDLISGKNIYSQLEVIFERADEKYNAGLFTFEKDRVPKEITISDKCLSKIIKGLYFPESPYEFSVMPLEILGSAYEEFLGKIIQIKSGKIKIEKKPDVKKAGGVFYTPEYIVRYMVESTVGKLIEGKTPKQIAKIKILDPASGSGSFLLGAYTYLLEYHQNWFFKNAPKSKGRKTDSLNPDGTLKTEIKKQILLNNIYGVDIDRNAVEVTKLSLLLKCLENETEETIDYQHEMLHKRILPTLDENIKCGNSLVGMEYLENSSSLKDQKIVKPFDWETSFETVFKAKKGFDVVIGNPPWVRQELLSSLKPYFKENYKVFNGKADLYTFFIEKGLSLLSNKGTFGYIVPNKWFRADYGSSLRLFLKNKSLSKIVDFGDVQIFKKATTYPCIIFLEPNKKSEHFKSAFVEELDFDLLSVFLKNKFKNIKIANLRKDFWCVKSESDIGLLNKLLDNGLSLEQYAGKDTYRGVITGLNEAFVINEVKKKELIIKDKNSEDLIKPFLAGKEVKQYQKLEKKNYVIFTRRGIDIKKWPAVKDHLNEFKKSLMPKPKGWKPKKQDEKWAGRKAGSYEWYEIQDSIDYYKEFEKPKIIYPNICKRPEFTFDSDGLYTNQKCYIIAAKDKYLLAVLNSSVMEYLFKSILPKLRGGYLEPNYIIFKRFPIPDKKKWPKEALKISKIADNVLKYQESDENDKVKFYKKEIDKVVYKLYKLDDSEINFIKESI